MSVKLRLKLLGGFHLEDAEGRSISLALRKAQALMAYLAVVKGQSAGRDQLVNLLWAGSDPQRARQSLRQTLASLTKALGEDAEEVLRSEGQEIGLVSGAVSVDVVEMEWLLAEGSMQSLIESKSLYRGDFLAGLAIEAPEYEEWAQDLRGQLRDMIVVGMEELFDQQAEGEEIGAAVATGNQVIRIDPLREDMHRKLIKLYARKGMRSSALAQYRACRDILAGELGVEPDEETRDLVKDLLDQRQEEDKRSLLRLDCIEGSGLDAVDAPADSEGFARLFGPVAGAVEQLRAQVLKTHYNVMTRQLCDAGKKGTALEAALKGARLERKRGSLHAAQSILEQAVASFDNGSDGAGNGTATESGETLSDLHLQLAELAEERSDMEGARYSLGLAEAAAQAGPENARPARLPLARSRIMVRSSRDREGVEAARGALERAGGAVDKDAWLPAERWVAQLHLSIARAEAMAKDLERQIELCSELGLASDESENRALLAVIKASRGDLLRGQSESNEAVELAQRAASQAALTAALQAQGLVLLWSGRSHLALGSIDAALRAAQNRGDLLRGYTLRGLRGAALLAEGRHDEAWSALKQANARARDLGTQFLLPFFTAWMAETVCSSGRYGETQPVCEEALRFAQESNQPWAASIAGRALARSLADPQDEDLAEAERAIGWSVCTQRDLGLDYDLARSLMIQARLFDLKGEAGRAEATAGEAERIIVRIGAAAGAAARREPLGQPA